MLGISVSRDERVYVMPPVAAQLLIYICACILLSQMVFTDTPMAYTYSVSSHVAEFGQ